MNKSIITLLFFTFVLGASTLSAQVVEEIEPTRGLFYYSGTLDSSTKIEFNLQFNGNMVSGSYIFEDSGDMFVFTGRMAVDRKGIGVLVYNTDNLYVASIEASFVNEENNFGKHLTGKWKSANGKQQKSIKLKKVAEFAEGPASSPILEESYGE